MDLLPDYPKVDFPEKSLIELAYKLYSKAEHTPFLKGTKLKEIEIHDLDYNWVRRLLNSRLILKGGSRGKYLIYPPDLFFNLLYTRDEVEFNYKWVRNVLPDSIIITGGDISPYTKDGYVSIEIDVILVEKDLVKKLYNSLVKFGVYFWHVPNAHRIDKTALMAYTQLVRCDPRNLVNSHQIVKKMVKKQKNELVSLFSMSHLPAVIIYFFCDVINVPHPQIKPRLLHPMFYENWSLALEDNGYSYAMFMKPRM